jgi:hypothetical protein
LDFLIRVKTGTENGYSLTGLVKTHDWDTENEELNWADGIFGSFANFSPLIYVWHWRERKMEHLEGIAT